MKKISRSSAPTVPADSSFNAVTSSPLRATREISFEESTVPVQYPHRLSLYLQPPAYEITIEDFEELALARLERKKLLRG